MSRKKLSKTKKAAPIKLAWLEQIIKHHWPTKPAKGSMIATAAILATYANPDGQDCYPAISTVAVQARIKPQTVIDCIKAMRAAGMLEMQGKVHTGQNRYRLCLAAMPDETLPDTEQIAPSIASSIAPRDTQLPTLERKREGGGDSSPAGNTPTAVATGSNISDTTTTRIAVLIHGEHADLIVSEFVAAFDAKFAKRERSRTTPTQRLEPTHQKLRTAIITKIDAGWPSEHLIERLINQLPADERKITTLTGLVASTVAKLPDQPDHDARRFITAQEVTAAAERSLKEAELKLQEQAAADQLKREHITATTRRNKAIKRLEKALEKYSDATDLDAELARIITALDAEAQYESDPAGWPLSQAWIECADAEIEELRDEATRRARVADAINQCRCMLGRSGIAHDKQDQHINERLAAHNLDREKIKEWQHLESGIAILKTYIAEIEHSIAAIPSGQQQW